MVRQQRLGQQDHQQMAQDMRLGDTCVFAGRPAQADAAFQMFESDLDAPAQTVEFADLGGGKVRCVE